jgi:hypothetical protein
MVAVHGYACGFPVDASWCCYAMSSGSKVCLSVYAATPALEDAQREELQLLYQAWQGQQWLQADGWSSSTIHCQWAGVSCCSNVSGRLQQPAWRGEDRWRLVDLPCCCCCSSPGTVVALQLPASNLTGNFSSLTHSSNSSLASNVAGSPQLAGSIGHGIGTFQQLQGLSASSCKLSGQLPGSLAICQA